MRTLISSLAAAILCSACADGAEDCRNTATCPVPPDAGVTVIYVTPDAGHCDGVCAPVPPAGNEWSPPFIVWTGAMDNLPNPLCPTQAPVPSTLWYSEPVQMLDCPSCSCAPSTGVCALPETVTVSASSACPSDAGDAGVPFDPPSAWDGGCTTNDAIADVSCDGGPCLATVGPMVPIDECVPSPIVTPKIVTWTLGAYSCTGTTSGPCDGPSVVCTTAPTVPNSLVAYTLCVSREGDDPNIMCPDDYPVPNVFYRAADDNRSCAPCGCEPPQGSSCSSLVSLYSDDACAVQAGAVVAESSGAMCVSVPVGSPLGSKQAGPPMYTSGSCQPNGGGVTGAVQPKDPTTFCCQ